MDRGPGAPVLPTPRPERETILDAGVVAYNEERTIQRAVRSLLEQELPPGLRWGTVWIVASGCTDATVRVAAALATSDARVRLVVEGERSGKAHALRDVLRRASGDLLVLLNADAKAEPGAVSALVRASVGVPKPFAIMARPVPPEGPGTRFERVVELLWSVHHELHLEVPIAPNGANLSDEMLLLSLPQVPALRDGTINDGASLGVSLSRNGGGVRYAPDAQVRISTPASLGDLLRQRRRIRTGYGQIAKELGSVPMTLPRLLATDPRRAVRVLRRSLKEGHHHVGDLLVLATGELASFLLALWDAIPPRKDHVRWARIRSPAAPIPSPPEPAVPTPTPLPVPPWLPQAERRLATLLRVAAEHRTGLGVDELDSLLPCDAPAQREEILRWIDRRPGLARRDGDRIFASAGDAAAFAERRARGQRYHAEARRLVDGHLGPVMPWVRCVGVTGSAAYGTPEEGDDLDLLVITQRGTLWVCLTWAYLAVRLQFLARASRNRPQPCFNYVLDDPVARAEFARPQGLLFAREALTARILEGTDYYGALLAAAPWLGEELPRLYEQRRGSDPMPPARPAPWAVRALNSALYLPVAAYLHLVGLRRNSRNPANGDSRGEFRVITGLGRMALTSARFERLRSVYEPRMPLPPHPNLATAAPDPRSSGRSPEGSILRSPPAPSAYLEVPTRGPRVPWEAAVPEAISGASPPNDLARSGARP